ncbi:hypothetical protein NH00_03885 [Enterobacter cancerogenus]|jgi:hypothetical protein|nr:hypothetical protein NH00_03885 [Enterobacter cancerogenus]
MFTIRTVIKYPRFTLFLMILLVINICGVNYISDRYSFENGLDIIFWSIWVEVPIFFITLYPAISRDLSKIS